MASSPTAPHFFKIILQQTHLNKLVRDSHFHVIIFDTTNTEIDYPHSPNHFEKQNVHIDDDDDDDDDDDSIQVLDSFPRNPKTRDKSPIPCSRPQKKMRPSVPGKPQSSNTKAAEIAATPSKRNVKLDSSSPSDDSSFASDDESSMLSLNIISEKEQKKTIVEDSDKSAKLMSKANTGNKGAYKKPSSSETTNTFSSKNGSLKVVLRPSHLKRHKLNIPKHFARQHFKDKTQTLTLWVGVRCWHVKFLVCRESSFSAGWKEFTRANSLKPGDACIFEVINKNQSELKVTIIRKSGENSSFESDDESSMVSPNIFSDKEQEKIVMEEEDSDTDESTKMISKVNTGNKGTNKRASFSETTSHFFSENPSIKVDLRPFHLEGHNLNIPVHFARQHLKDKTQTMTLWVGERCWDVRLLAHRKYFSFSAGWKEFTRDNSLKPGDVCIFELIKGNQSELKVTIIRKSGENATSKISTATPSKRNVTLDSSFAGNNKARNISQNIIKKKDREKVIAELSEKSTNLISEANTGNNQDRPSSSSSKFSVWKDGLDIRGA
ncbi:hypothetical protein F8388_017068 [Cannabis sativa]|uniref:TF-B3 domain-containing protein n=1 Tax=Cannabis sativa TaxID=3483 RepID=A0A7J6GCR3_CANSA|nr:hypothetical protein F8388_017068 [Cannabis sativa]